MRLIDADALQDRIKADAAGIVNGNIEDLSVRIANVWISGFEEYIDNAPTIDAKPKPQALELPDYEYIEIVRCKDCKWYSNHHLCIQMSRFGSIEPLADFFCAFGERNEE